jgi:uncharacterized membrane protein
MQISSDDSPKAIAVKLALVAVVGGAFLFFRYVGMSSDEASFALVLAFCSIIVLAMWVYWRWFIPERTPPEDQNSNWPTH